MKAIINHTYSIKFTRALLFLVLFLTLSPTITLAQVTLVSGSCSGTDCDLMSVNCRLIGGTPQERGSAIIGSGEIICNLPPPPPPAGAGTITSSQSCEPGIGCERALGICTASQGTSYIKIESGIPFVVCTRPEGSPIVDPYANQGGGSGTGGGRANGTFVPLVGIPGVNPDADFGTYINALYVLSISLAALLAVIKIIVAGVKWMLTDVVTRKEDAKKDIQAALTGLLIIISAVVILTTINPNLVKFNLLPETTVTTP